MTLPLGAEVFEPVINSVLAGVVLFTDAGVAVFAGEGSETLGLGLRVTGATAKSVGLVALDVGTGLVGV